MCIRDRSEFKYACPVCGQHMMCDSSQAGTVMECPTCFQKITAPQAPAGDDQKFVLTGTKVGDRPMPKFSGAASSFVPAAKGFPGALVVVVILIFIGAAVAFVYRGTIFKSKNHSTTAESSQSLSLIHISEGTVLGSRSPHPLKPTIAMSCRRSAEWI